LVLRGRCRHCHQPIALRYPLVEFLCAGLWVAMLAANPGGFGASPDPLGLVLSGWLLVSWLFPLVLIDLDLLWLPEPLCRWGLLLGLAVTGLLGFAQGVSEGRALLLAHLIAAALGLLGCEAVSALGQRCLGRPALGLGDAKLAALMGAWLGPLSLGLALLVAVVSGAVVGSLGRLTGRLGPQQPFPFGPFLAFGTVAVWWSGPGPWLEKPPEPWLRQVMPNHASAMIPTRQKSQVQRHWAGSSSSPRRRLWNRATKASAVTRPQLNHAPRPAASCS
jgi:leader peptidase (prepilin peptidase)/N-methyltransferase